MKSWGGKVLDNFVEICFGAALIILTVLSTSYFDTFVKKDVFADYKISEGKFDSEMRTNINVIKEDVQFIKTFIYEHLKDKH